MTEELCLEHKIKQYFARKNRKGKLLYAVMGTVLFSLAANGFIYFNYYPQHDSLNHAQWFAGGWEVSLGRFLLPIYGNIFGQITAPWLIGIVSMVFLSATIFLIADLFMLEDRWTILFISGVVSANLSITNMYTAYIYITGSYALALFLAVLGGYLVMQKQSIGRILAAIFCLVFSLGLYQAFIACTLVLLLFAVCQDILSVCKIQKCLPKWGVFCLTLFGAAVLYLIGYKGALAYWNTTPAQTQNSIASVLLLSPGILWQRIKHGYSLFLDFFYSSDTILGPVFAVCNVGISVLLCILIILYLLQKKLPTVNQGILLLFAMVYPGVSLLTGILQGAESIYWLVSFSVFFSYIGVLLVASKVPYREKKMRSAAKILRRGIFLFVAIVLWQNIVYSNGAYTTQKLLYDRTVSVMTRVLSNMDETPGYEMGETPVVILGSPSESENLTSITQQYSDLTAFGNTSVTYQQTFGSFASIMGESINFLQDETAISACVNSAEVHAMPSYPQLGYCKMVGEYMVVKFSD